MDRNQACSCGSGKKFKKCCGLKSSPKNKKNKILILILSTILIFGAGYGFKQIIDKNRESANPNATYCPDCGRYH